MPDSAWGWVWWTFSVIIVGIVINIISPGIGKILAQRFESYRHWRVANNASRNAFVNKLVERMEAEPQLVNIVIHEYMEHRHWASLFILYSLLLILLALIGKPWAQGNEELVPVIKVGGTISIIFSLLLVSASIAINSSAQAYSEAIDQYKKNHDIRRES